ncbi:MAG: hypothetical protein H6605_05275 [Flavobacteriales bacterium]|nr:hypothetical protein [Flavobacteriales bacterium]
MNFSNYIILLIVFISISCTNDSSNNLNIEEEIKEKLNSISNFPIKSISFNLKDTALELPDDIRFYLLKNSILNMDSTPYDGKVNLKWEFINDSIELLSHYLNNLYPESALIRGILRIKITDGHGKELIVNNKNPPRITFHPKLNLFNSFYFYKDKFDSGFSSPILFHKIYKNYKKNNEEKDYIGPISYGDFIDTSSNSSIKNVENDGYLLSRQELIGYELTIKEFGYYYISDEDKIHNLQNCNIQVDVRIEGEEENIWQTKLFIFTQQSDYNYYLSAEHIGKNRFEIAKTVHNHQLRLPLDNSYTLMGYLIIDDKCYFYKKKGIRLRINNNLKIKLKKISYEKLLEQVRNF